MRVWSPLLIVHAMHTASAYIPLCLCSVNSRTPLPMPARTSTWTYYYPHTTLIPSLHNAAIPRIVACTYVDYACNTPLPSPIPSERHLDGCRGSVGLSPHDGRTSSVELSALVGGRRYFARFPLLPLFGRDSRRLTVVRAISPAVSPPPRVKAKSHPPSPVVLLSPLLSYYACSCFVVSWAVAM